MEVASLLNRRLLAAAVVALLASSPSAFAGKHKKCDTCPSGGTIIMDSAPAAEGAAPPAPAASPLADSDIFAGSYDVASASDTLAPGMLGDVNVGGPQSVGGFNRFKIADGQSPLPQCRVSLLYNYFNDVGPNGPANNLYGYDIHRMSVAIEQCMFDSWVSIGVRSFIENIQDSNFHEGHQFWDAGNTLVTLKSLLARTDTFALSTGLGINIPTASGSSSIPRTGSLQPFIGYLYQPSRLFFQGFVSADLATHADNASFLWVDSGVGYFLYESPGSMLSAIIPMVEVHATLPLNNYAGIYNPQTTFVANGQTLTVGAISQDVVNVTSALTLRFYDNIDFQAGVAAPVSTDRQFTLEALAQLHVRY